MILSSLRLPLLPFYEVLALDITAAFAAYLLYKRYEPRISLLHIHFLLLVALPGYVSTTFGPHFINSPHLGVVTAFSIFYTTLLSSVVGYRLSPWHALAQYPGPTSARVSKLWGAVRLAKGNYHRELKELHATFGPYVRVGPNEISTTDIDVFPTVLTSMTKGPMWEARTAEAQGVESVIAIRKFHEHSRRRKPWARAFNTNAIKGYEPIVQNRALQLVSSLERKATSTTEFNNAIIPEYDALNLAGWLNYFTTDFMGDMAFGGGFELMRDDGDKEGIWTLIESGMPFLAFFQHFPWLMPLVRGLPFVNEASRRFRDFASDRVRMRKEKGSLTKDLFYHLIDEGDVEKVKPSLTQVLSDGGLAIVAGSDTTSTVLSGLFSSLLSNAVVYLRLQKEVDTVFPREDGYPFDSYKLEKDMPYLNAVINEAMRLQPPVPTHLQRKAEAGSGGKWINNRFFDENTAVLVPLYVIGRDPKYFSPAPEIFWPDRWLSNPDIASLPSSAGPLERGPVVTNTAAFLPFSHGPANCAGKGLALMEMRVVVALILQKFEMRLADGYDPSRWEADLEDFFVMKNGKLPVVLTPRA